ncbi:hypothetical protein MASR2M44_26340 [Bacteroidota bacterium]
MNTVMGKLFARTGLVLAMLSLVVVASARENSGLGKRSQTKLLKKAGGCEAATQQKDLDVNNVRTTILNGGDMWWNLSNARYEIPKVPSGQVSKHSLFSGALWIGGITQGNLRIAAQTYRQSGNDYYPGPLQVDGASRGTITKERCKDFDQIWKVTLQEIEVFRNNADKSNPSDAIATWPCKGGPGEAAILAPFFDTNNDGIYDPFAGDYPSFDQNRSDNIPDMMMYVIYNDKGNIHSETEGLPIGLELHTQCFGYATNDEINNMTFYRTTIYNRGTETIDSCIFGQWVDADLGNYSDDYVECDVKRNLGICYNGDDNDEGILGYGLNPPSVGVNFFEGPRRPDGSEIGLTKFVYYNNDFSITGNPSRPEHYWNYLNGRWKDGLNITYGGNGRGGSDTASFMFPGSSDPANREAWTERIAGNQPGDRRFMQTAGPFSMLPGAKNQVTIAVVWARATTGGATGSFNLLKEASDKAYVLYKNNFKFIDGPKIPSLEITELDRKLILNITNYQETEKYIDSTAGLCADKTIYKFQGYQIFQTKTSATPGDIYNSDEARLVAQCDIVDGVNLIVNIVNDADLGNVKKIMVNGADKGVSHSFEITKDLFSTASDQTLSNFKNYHYYLVAYASATNCSSEQTQYLAGRKRWDGSGNLTVMGVPHKAAPHGQGTVLNSNYGEGPEIEKIEGIGNSGHSIQLTEESIQKALLAPYYVEVPKYTKGFGPLLVKVVNPFKIPKATFELRLSDTSSSDKNIALNKDTATWYLKNLTTGEIIEGERVIGVRNEQMFTKWGLSVQMEQAVAPGNPDDETDVSNGFISAEISYANENYPWLAGVPDEAAPLVPFNWIRSGNTGSSNFDNFYEHDFAAGTPKRSLDPRKAYSKIINGTWAPYALCARALANTATGTGSTFGPAWAVGSDGVSLGIGGASDDNSLSDLQSVQIVFTNDKTKWSRCVVLEAGETPATTIGGAVKLNRRKSPSVDQNGKPVAGTGMGWFPGYAINLETGERLNIMFAEDSSLPTENGSDMIWNPTANYIRNDISGTEILFGGKHHVYIMGSKPFRTSPTGPVRYQGPRYDEGRSYDSLFNLIEAGTSASLNKRYLFSQAMWVTIPMSVNQFPMWKIEDGLIPTEAKVTLRVKRPFARYTATSSVLENNGLPLYRFSTENIAPEVGTKEAGKTALDLVSVSPNPYYAYAGYEDPTNQLDTRVRLNNLPKKCVVSIYTQSGFLVRRIRKDDDQRTYIDWNLKNDANVPISSGVYLIHIYADGIGERVVKWFGIMRKADFDTF